MLFFISIVFLFPTLKANADVVAPIKILLIPGHDNVVWGAEYENLKEADMNLAVATQIYNLLKKDKRFEIVTDSILNIKSENDLGILTCSNQTYQSKFIFNSALRTQQIKSNHVNYLQHFKGWFIEAPEYVFDLNNPVFMDFSVEQKDDCRFIYLIPQSKHTALIEYTGFSPNIIDDDEYNHELNNYIKK